ncbi:MAG: HEAT repeat domain-containing protein [Planctomycetota bacterium]|nr:HEAT repeat domain-containing protein [Planctomycetota bacterium]
MVFHAQISSFRVGPFAQAACVLLGASLAAGCMQNVDPSAARAAFSSKNRSLPQNGANPSTASGATLNAAAGSSASSASPDELSTPPAGLLAAGQPPVLHEPVLSESELPRREAVATEAERSGAASILRAASRSNWAALRANAIEASKSSRPLLAELAPRGLVDENRGVRFVACMAIGESRDRDLGVLVQPLVQDESASVRAAAMLALSRCGHTVDLTPIAAMLADNEPEVRANAYLVLGELGNRSAVPLIRDSIGRGMKLVNPIRARLVDLTAAEALVKLGDDREIEPLRAALFAPPEQAELTLVACDAIGRLRDEVSRPMLERLLSVSGDGRRSPEIRIAAARALMRIGDATPAALSIAREYLGNPDGRIRSQAAALLGQVRTPESFDLLSRLLRDADPTVQVSAAAGIERGE